MQPRQDPRSLVKAKLEQILHLGANIQIKVEFSKDDQGQPDYNGYTFTLEDRNGNLVHEDSLEAYITTLERLGLHPERLYGDSIHLDRDNSRNLLQLGQQQTYAQPAPAAYPPSATARTQPQVAQPTYYQQQNATSFYQAQPQPLQQNPPPHIQTPFLQNIIYNLQQHDCKGLVSVEIGAETGKPGECVLFIQFQSPQFANVFAYKIGELQRHVPRENDRTLVVSSERAKVMFGELFRLQSPDVTYKNMRNDYNRITSQGALQQSPAPRK